MEINEKYTEILKLNDLLSKTKIPYSIDRMYDGWQIVYFFKGERIGDVVQHFGSYGSEDNKLEIMGILTPEKYDVLGNLTAEQCYERIMIDFLNRKFGTKGR